MSARLDALALTWGTFLFRWRSYLPLLLVPVLILAVTYCQHPIRSHLGDLAWEVACFVLALVGFAMRAVTVGFAAPGTSGRNTRRQKARSLNTTGPYSIVRHPLYLSNTVIALAFALFPHTWAAPPVVTVLALGYYATIARREEAFLRERFGVAFETWAARVPAIVPNRTRWVTPARRFDWHTVVRREFYALALIFVMPLIVDVMEDFIEEGMLDLDVVWTVVAAAGLVIFVAFRLVKKRTSWLPPRPED